MRRLSVTLVAGAAAGVVTILGLPAEAESLGGEDGVRYKRSTATIPASTGSPTDVGNGTTCGKGQAAVGGGFAIKGGQGRGIATSSKIERREWFVDAWQSGRRESKLRTYAVCLRTDRVVEEDTAQFDLDAGPSSLRDAAYCPDGHVVSGGVRTLGEPSDFSLGSSYPVDDATDTDKVPDDGWRGKLRYTGDGGDDAFFDAVCVVGAQPAYRKTVVEVKAGEVGSARTWCPRGREVVGGGFRVSGSTKASHVIRSRPVDSKDRGTVPDDGWLGAVSNTSAKDLRLTVHAVCR